ncbi:MAG: hypothetical protein H7256_10910, partial [Bdellovibrio sp.]|nr:hypothetical protein [Bdellovibrio sp.]
KSFDIYEDRLEFVNANGNLSLICTHTTVGLFLEEVAKNLAAYITITTDNVAINASKFVNSLTQERMLNAVQILDESKMNQITMSANPNDVLTTENKSICKVTQKTGQYDLNKTYFKVATGPLVKSADGQTRIESSVYQADKNNYFTMACQFSAEVNSENEIMSAAKDIIKFGALDRIQYNEKYKEALDQREINNPTGSSCQSL